MALFQIFRGDEDGLKAVPCHDGYAYFTEDKGNFFIDIGNNEGDRVQVNAYYAEVLRKFVEKEDGSTTITEIDIDDLLLKDAVIAVENGGTGQNELTLNAVIIGNGTDSVKMVKIAAGGVVVGDDDNGIKGISGIGAFYALTAGAPAFGTLPIAAGGTGATSAEGGRSNLDVYSKGEVDTKVAEATTIAYATTLLKEGWQDGTYTYLNADLKCGKNGNVPLLITYTSNKDEYSKIDTAEATAGEKIVFTYENGENPTADIGIIIIDVQ